MAAGGGVEWGEVVWCGVWWSGVVAWWCDVGRGEAVWAGVARGGVGWGGVGWSGVKWGGVPGMGWGGVGMARRGGGCLLEACDTLTHCRPGKKKVSQPRPRKPHAQTPRHPSCAAAPGGPEAASSTSALPALAIPLWLAYTHFYV